MVWNQSSESAQTFQVQPITRETCEINLQLKNITSRNLKLEMWEKQSKKRIVNQFLVQLWPKFRKTIKCAKVFQFDYNKIRRVYKN